MTRGNKCSYKCPLFASAVRSILALSHLAALCLYLGTISGSSGLWGHLGYIIACNRDDDGKSWLLGLGVDCNGDESGLGVGRKWRITPAGRKASHGTNCNVPWYQQRVRVDTQLKQGNSAAMARSDRRRKGKDGEALEKEGSDE